MQPVHQLWQRDVHVLYTQAMFATCLPNLRHFYNVEHISCVGRARFARKKAKKSGFCHFWRRFAADSRLKAALEGREHHLLPGPFYIIKLQRLRRVAAPKAAAYDFCSQFFFDFLK